MSGPSRPLRLPDGRWVLPGNRTDLLDGLVPEPPPVSVVVPYYADQRRLDLVLTGLSLQTHPATRLEVVVADDGSPTPPDLSHLAPAIARTLVRQDDRGFRAAAARNLGARAAAGGVLCFLDGDTVPTPDYVARVTRLPALASDAVTTGRRRHADLSEVDPARLARWLTAGTDPPPSLPEPSWLHDLHRRTADLARLTDRSYEGVISAVLATSAELFAETGGFDESFVRYGGEDWEWGFRALNAGALLAHVPEAVAWHDGPDWGLRSADDPERAGATKEAETARLRALIPGLGPSGPAAVALSVLAPEPARTDAVTTYLADPALDAVLSPPYPPGPATVRLEVVGDGAPLPSSTLAALRARVGLGRSGRVVHHEQGWTITATSTAAASRAARWAGAWPDEDLVARLFPVALDRPRSAAATSFRSL